MRVILIASQKGGAGKSTLAAHFATLASRKGLAVLVDADPQGSLSYWHALRQRDDLLLVKSSGGGDVAGIIRDAKASRVDTLLVDSEPRNDAALAAWVRVADLVAVPVRPGAFDIAAAAVTFEAVRALQGRAVAVLNACPPPGAYGEPSIVREAREALEGQGVEVLKGQVSQRAALAHALVSGLTVGEYEPDGKAAEEIAAVWRQVDRLTR